MIDIKYQECIQSVIDYIENHLTDVIDPKMIEKIACCSYYDVGKIFSLIANINISDYIRKRRLTRAGVELKHNNAKVIDIALKYGYDSPVSFARAFQNFHGFNPSLANKRYSVLNVFPRLAYQICVKCVMDAMYRVKMTINGNEYEASYFGFCCFYTLIVFRRTVPVSDSHHNVYDVDILVQHEKWKE